MSTEHYTGGCHCKAVRFEVDIDLDKVIACNCSHCASRGAILGFAPTSQFKLLSGEDALIEYRFYKHVIEHRFCKHCGVGPFSRANAPDGTPTIAINVRSLDNVDPLSLKPMPFDGKKL